MPTSSFGTNPGRCPYYSGRDYLRDALPWGSSGFSKLPRYRVYSTDTEVHKGAQQSVVLSIAPSSIRGTRLVPEVDKFSSQNLWRKLYGCASSESGIQT